jgi:7-carboxy-7-deazaguanine synthase (Cx14CxxC type)
MTYAVKEIFFTLQGEGANSGRAAVFCRFAGCNLWSGREQDRATAVCTFCDTDFVGTDGAGGGSFRGAAELAEQIAALWSMQCGSQSRAFVVFTGGEPLLQLDAALIDAVHAHGFEIAVETNGTQRAPAGIDWLCVSPKADSPLVLTGGDELKLVYPQPLAPPERFESLDFKSFYLQPMDGADYPANMAATLRYCMAHPRWRFSLQMHKVAGIP